MAETVVSPPSLRVAQRIKRLAGEGFKRACRGPLFAEERRRTSAAKKPDMPLVMAV